MKASFTSTDEALAAFAKALAHPSRIAILRVLAERTSCVCGEIVDVLPLAQATVSQLLKALNIAGLVVGTIDGPRSCYCLNPRALEGVRDALGVYFDCIIPTKHGDNHVDRTTNDDEHKGATVGGGTAETRGADQVRRNRKGCC